MRMKSGRKMLDSELNKGVKEIYKHHDSYATTRKLTLRLQNYQFSLNAKLISAVSHDISTCIANV